MATRRLRGPLELHDIWNLAALGTLNVCHIGWWCGALAGSSRALSWLFWADAAYLVADCGWLLLVPGCVPAASRNTLLIHHLLVCALVPIAAGKPVLMAHLLRVWCVEIHSWNHIAARQFSSTRIGAVARHINKPLFVALRLLYFPTSWFPYAAERAALPAAVAAAHVPPALHRCLAVAHLAMYGLMLKWGSGLLRGARSS